MVKIRLKRMGAHKKPFYRIVVADSRSARNGRFIEEIGYYDPLKEPPVIKVNGERAEYWLGEGAQPTDVVRGILKKSGVAVKSVTKKHAAPAPKKAEEESEPVAETVETAEAVEEAAAETTEETVAEEPAAEANEETAEAAE